MSEVVIQPQPGPQTRAAQCPARVLVYGGAAFGGKTWLQAYLSGRHHRTNGYHALLARRTHKMLKQSGGLWDQTLDLSKQLGAESAYPYIRWPGYGSKIEFSHLQHEKNAEDHKSAQYAYFGGDEASDFSGKQTSMLQSRVRTMAGVPPRIVYTTNPDPDCWLRPWVDWWIGEDGYPIPERDGVIRYYLRIRDEIVWKGSREELERYCDDPHDIRSFAFIAARATDNKLGLAADPNYLGELKALPEIMRARFEGGNWDAREAAGDFFQRGWFPEYGSTELERMIIGQTGAPWDIVHCVRFWDRAGTPVKGDLVPGIPRPADFKALEAGARDSDPDWSFSVKLGRFRNGKRVILDCCAYRDTPGAIEAAMMRHAREDGPRVTVGFWQDPAQAGIDQAERMKAILTKAGAQVWSTVQHKTKQEYAREPSRSAYRGEVLAHGAADLRKLWLHLESFPDKKKKDDGVDALAGAELFFAENPNPAYGYDSANRAVREATQTEASIFGHPMSRHDTVDSDDIRATGRFRDSL